MNDAHKFEAGTKAYDIRDGVVELKALPHHSARPLSSAGGVRSYHYDGREDGDHKNPILLTLDEARKRGYDVPDEPVRIECEVEWKKSGSFVIAVWPHQFDINQLVGKRGRLTFEEIKS